MVHEQCFSAVIPSWMVAPLKFGEFRPLSIFDQCKVERLLLNLSEWLAFFGFSYEDGHWVFDFDSRNYLIYQDELPISGVHATFVVFDKE